MPRTAMDAPSTIAHYRITAKLGEGGMGAVYRATDTKLNRNVAVKVLPAEFAADTGRMQRFEREAQVLAALNHPNIAAIYGIEAGAIVMELVEGEDLRGPVPANVAIGYARQMIGALEAAHQKGIVHRDLKPANIRVTADGVVKLLDFGLAKATEASAAVAGASPTISPTLSIGMTQAGMILGTAAYMSPEQARGKTIDQRADIWAFGVILYELLTGTPLYGGETITDTLAAVVLQEPDYSRLPVGTPSGLRRLIRGCLQKDPKTRLREIGDARLLLEEVETPSVAVAPRRSWLPWAVAAVAVAGTGVLASQWPKAAAPPVTVRFPLELPEGTTDPQRGLAAAQAVPSPDGKRLAFIAVSNGKPAIWIRSMDSPVAHRLDRTEGASLPFWSPDGQFLGYFEEGRLKKIPAAGGAPQTLAQFPQTTSSSRLSADGGAWGPDGTILYSPGDGPLMRTTASGGNAAPATALDEAQQEYKHASPQFLPDGKHVVYFAGSHDRQKNGIYVLELGSSRRTLLRRNPTRGAWGAPDYLLFLREGTLFAQRTNLDTGRATGEPMRIAEEVTGNEANGRTSFALSDSGVLVYRAGNIARRSRLAWLDRQGNRLSRIGGEGRYRSIRLSPDEKSAAVVVGAEGGYDIATIDLSTGVMSPLDTDGRTSSVSPAWSPDSRRLAVNISDQSGFLEVAVDSGQKRTVPVPDVYVNDWSPDGQSWIATQRTALHLSLVPVGGGTPQPIGDTSYRRISFHFSPDGKFVSYTSYESGRPQAMVASFPSFGERRQISVDGGEATTWRKDGKEVFFRSGSNVMSVDVRTQPRLEVGPPNRLFTTESFVYAPTGDGRRFLIIEADNNFPPTEVMVVANWAAGLRQQ